MWWSSAMRNFASWASIRDRTWLLGSRRSWTSRAVSYTLASRSRAKAPSSAVIAQITTKLAIRRVESVMPCNHLMYCPRGLLYDGDDPDQFDGRRVADIAHRVGIGSYI